MSEIPATFLNGPFGAFSESHAVGTLLADRRVRDAAYSVLRAECESATPLTPREVAERTQGDSRAALRSVMRALRATRPLWRAVEWVRLSPDAKVRWTGVHSERLYLLLFVALTDAHGHTTRQVAEMTIWQLLANTCDPDSAFADCMGAICNVLRHDQFAFQQAGSIIEVFVCPNLRAEMRRQLESEPDAMIILDPRG